MQQDASRSPSRSMRAEQWGADDKDPGLVSLVLSLEARLRAVEAATYSVVLVPRETSLPYKNMKEAGRKCAQLVEAKGRREHDLGSPHLHVFLALLTALATYVPPQGTDHAVSGPSRGLQGAAGAGHRASDADRVGRVGHDVQSRGLLRQAAAGEAGSNHGCHEGYDGCIVAPIRHGERDPASSSRAAPTSRGDRHEADERAERARIALVRARREAQGRGGPAGRESEGSRLLASTRTSSYEPSILLLLEGRTPSVPPRRRFRRM